MQKIHFKWRGPQTTKGMAWPKARTVFSCPTSEPAHTPASFLPREARATHRDLRLADFQHSCHSWDQPFCGSAQIFDAKSRREGILPQGGATCSFCVISCVVRYKLFKVQMIKLSLPIRGSTFKGATDRGRRIGKEDGAGAAVIFLSSWFRRQDALALVGTDLFFQTTCTGHRGRERMNTAVARAKKRNVFGHVGRPL